MFDLNLIVIDIMLTRLSEFDFHPDNHSVSRAEYKYPCLPIEYVNSSKVGFWSGFKPVKPTDEGVSLIIFPNKLYLTEKPDSKVLYKS